jgi:glutamyl-tRNA reductase
VAHELSKDDMRRLARLGAMRRLEDIRAEEAAIRAAFPELFSESRPAARRTTVASAANAAPVKATAPKKARKRAPMSPAMKKIVSERMKKYWAGRRKSKNG